jgi:hypothetical protein
MAPVISRKTGILRFFYLNIVTPLPSAFYWADLDYTAKSVPVFKPHVMNICYRSHVKFSWQWLWRYNLPGPRPGAPSLGGGGGEGKAIPLTQDGEAHWVVWRCGSHILYMSGTQMEVRLSVLHAGHPLPPGRFLVLISVRDQVNSRVILWLEGLDQLKNPMASSGIKPNLLACSMVRPLCTSFLWLAYCSILKMEAAVSKSLVKI